MKRPVSSLALLLLLALPAAWAGKADRSQPIEVEADSKSTDYKAGIGVYTGKVIIVQGSLRATADKATLYLKEGQLDRAVLEGKPVTYREMDDKGQWLEAEARQVDYFAARGELILTGQARVSRAGDVMTSERIEYDQKAEVLKAGRGDGQDRVHITLQPRTPGADGKTP
ncbi:MAG: lipopolysaccharide transport periplasmic protein LptA [Halothiobacillaceae bacterium]|nr:lipopolysaccharide transport periplasmic protein LptA [Halothiobacillaceae bacterium]